MRLSTLVQLHFSQSIVKDKKIPRLQSRRTQIEISSVTPICLIFMKSAPAIFLINVAEFVPSTFKPNRFLDGQGCMCDHFFDTLLAKKYNTEAYYVKLFS